MLEVFLGITVFFGGYMVGRVMENGAIIEIKIKDKNSAPVEYNESVIDELDPEIRNYYESTNGQNKF